MALLKLPLILSRHLDDYRGECFPSVKETLSIAAILTMLFKADRAPCGYALSALKYENRPLSVESVGVEKVEPPKAVPPFNFAQSGTAFGGSSLIAHTT